MSRARSVADLGNQNVLSVSATNGNINVGTGVTLENTGEAQFSGIVTAPSIDTRNLIGDVSIGGVLTYEDVTSVDSVGIVTAGNGLRVTDGGLVVTAGVSTFAGITTVTGETLFTNQLSVSGVSTLGSNVVVGGATTELVVTGDARVTGILTVGTASLTLDGATGNVSGASLHDTQVSAISKEITDTAVDVFVYDTSKDSDGGDWRKRTQHTSWYNETLGTAIRGTRKEFPAVAVIVASNADSSVTIYDGDDPDLPMWMVLERNNDTEDPYLDGSTPGASFLGNYPPSSVSAFNGIICAGTFRSAGALVNLNAGLRKFSFIEDACYATNDTNTYKLGTTFVDRNTVTMTQIAQGGAIAIANVNDVAMTVLPNAPVDSATGLPVPTIAVATDKGSSVIKDDGKVFDFNDATTAVRPATNIVIRGNDIVHWNVNNGTLQQFFNALTATADSYEEVQYNYTDAGGHGTCENVSALLRNSGNGPYHIVTRDSKSIAAGAQPGMSVFVDGDDRSIVVDNHSIFDSRVAYITSDYNTGWMHGDIKGAFLSDTDATNATATSGASNIIQNGDFGTGDLTNWTSAGDTTPSISAGGALLTSGVSVDGTIHQVISNAPYGALIEWTVTSNSANNFGLLINGTSASSTGTEVTEFTASGSYDFTGPLTGVGFRHRVSGNGVIDNIVVRPYTEADRSVISKGLRTYGTITKSPVVGTGVSAAELVSYSGWSSSNYLQQPYNSDLNFGTNDFSIMGWVNVTGSDTYMQGLIHRNTPVTADGGGFLIEYRYDQDCLLMQTDDGTTVNNLFSANNSVKANVWTHFCAVVKTSETRMEIYINGKLSNGSNYGSARNVTNTSAITLIGREILLSAEDNRYFDGSIALLRISGSAPSPEQIKKMYDDEKVLFQENAACTLYGSSDAVTALAYDDTTELLHVGTSAGRSEFQGLRQINNTTVGITSAISASNDLVAEK